MALLGGSFDPFQNAHLELALAAKEQLDLDAVVYIPARKNPLKDRGLETSRAQRLHMVACGIQGEEGLFVSPIDLRRTGDSYTIHTVREVWETLPAGSQLFFLAGADVIHSLEDWRYLDELLPLVQFAPVSREGQSDIDFKGLATHIGDEEASLFQSHLVHFDSPLSSTVVRTRIASGREIKGLVPPAVEEFIQSHELYQLRGI